MTGISRLQHFNKHPLGKLVCIYLGDHHNEMQIGSSETDETCRRTAIYLWRDARSSNIAVCVIKNVNAGSHVDIIDREQALFVSMNNPPRFVEVDLFPAAKFLHDRYILPGVLA